MGNAIVIDVQPQKGTSARLRFYLERTVRTGISAHAFALPVGVLVAWMDQSNARVMNGALSYLLCNGIIMVMDLALWRECAQSTIPMEQPPAPPAPIADPPAQLRRLEPEQPPYRLLAERPPSRWGEWAVITSRDDRLTAMFDVLARMSLSDAISVRTMQGTLNRLEVRRLQSFLHSRGWSTTHRGAQVLTERGVLEVREMAAHLPH